MYQEIGLESRGWRHFGSGKDKNYFEIKVFNLLSNGKTIFAKRSKTLWLNWKTDF